MNAQSTAVAVLETPRLPVPEDLGGHYDLTPGKWRVLLDQIFPTAKSAESIIMALDYCKARGLDPMKKPVHIVPMWSSVQGKKIETVWPGIAEIRTTAARTGVYAGLDEVEFGPMETKNFRGEKTSYEVTFPSYAKITVYRIVQGVRCPFPATVWWEEAYARAGNSEAPNEMWRKRPRGQIAKCVEAAALRMAFPEELGGIYAAEEIEGHTIEHGVQRAREGAMASMGERYSGNNEPARASIPPERAVAGGGNSPVPAAAGDPSSQEPIAELTAEETVVLQNYWLALRKVLVEFDDGADGPPLGDLIRGAHEGFVDVLKDGSPACKAAATAIWKTVVAINKGDTDIHTAHQHYCEMLGIEEDGDAS